LDCQLVEFGEPGWDIVGQMLKAVERSDCSHGVLFDWAAEVELAVIAQVGD